MAAHCVVSLDSLLAKVDQPGAHILNAEDHQKVLTPYPGLLSCGGENSQQCTTEGTGLEDVGSDLESTSNQLRKIEKVV